MKRPAAILALSASALALTATTALAEYALNILHINDWHSRIESINKYDSTCSAEDEAEGACFGGAARLVTAVREQRQAMDGDNLLFLNAGDNFQGSLFYTTYKGAVEAEFLNLMGTDAMAVGNHEFDDGEDGLATFLDAAEFPVLSANVAAKPDSSLGDRVKAYVVMEVGGERIAIVGAVANDTAELSSPGDNVDITDDVEETTRAVEAATAEGVDKVIALTHVGYPRDLAAIARIPGVDVVVGGHSHTLLSNTVEGAAGPYPTMVDNPEGYQVPVVQAGSYSKYLGKLNVVFDDAGRVVEASGEPLLLDASVEPDPQVAARIAELGAPIEELKSKPVSETTAAIDGSRESCRAGECAMGNLVAEAMLERVRDQGIDIAIQNGGGLRASIDAGEITMGEVLAVLPFQNTLAAFQLKGRDIRQSLENGVSAIEDGAGRFPQVAGLRYSFDPAGTPNENRITAVEVREDGAWVPLDPEATYGVVSNNFMRGGGDGYGLFASNAENAYDYGPGLEQVVADYLADNRPYTPATDGRITEVAATDAAPAADGEAAMPADDAAAEPATPELPEMSKTLASEPPPAPAEDAAAEDGVAMDEAMADGESIAEEPTADEPADGATMAEDAAAEEPMAEDAAAGEPMADDAMDEAMADGESIAEEPTADEPADGATMAEDAAAGEPMADDAMDEAMADGESIAEEPTADEPADGATMAEDAAAEEPMAEDAMADEAMQDEQPAADDAAQGESMDAGAMEGEAMAGEKRHVVVAGDNYWNLARTYYDDPGRWRDIAEANPDMPPNALRVGAELVIPAN
ncbi:5'-nucleotidase C-terminal domain-containing protein [Aquibium sp. A9E412]|uniref:5'-nucleotidase C-terminal domain-containing protein n=1 Tax=Aquibium sp. A9E412 TaxID=2976767 RepID=UPI0025B21C7D|nr:5'-nucleotidase C-terminal domain-containing protein [Aquibium sp. A9E412]MDN2565035.1 5'-nucleotidase C-terminal domain-containing protein [Aquibium sp. A9E412]